MNISLEFDSDNVFYNVVAVDQTAVAIYQDLILRKVADLCDCSTVFRKPFVADLHYSYISGTSVFRFD